MRLFRFLGDLTVGSLKRGNQSLWRKWGLFLYLSDGGEGERAGRGGEGVSSTAHVGFGKWVRNRVYDHQYPIYYKLTSLGYL